MIWQLQWLAEDRGTDQQIAASLQTRITSCLRFISASRSVVGVNVVCPCPILSDLLSQFERRMRRSLWCRRRFRPFIENVDE